MEAVHILQSTTLNINKEYVQIDQPEPDEAAMEVDAVDDSLALEIYASEEHCVGNDNIMVVIDSPAAPPDIMEEIDVIEQVDIDVIEQVDVDEEQDASSDVEMEAMPKLIPIKSKRLDVKSPTEMPPLIPITKHNNRLHMAQLIERKLQSEIEEYDYEDNQSPPVAVTNGHGDPEDNSEETQEIVEEEDESALLTEVTEIVEEEVVTDDWDLIQTEDDEEQFKKPFIGSIHKSVRKAARLTRPPWLTNEDDESDENERDNADEEENNVSVHEMRAQLCSQLQMLKVKKKTEPLFHTKLSHFANVHYEKRSLKAVLETSESNDMSPLGIKIVAVSGGVDIEKCKELLPLDTCNDNKLEQETESENEGLKEVIINEHLDSPTIKLTKTKDYTKIKGWNKKRLLTHNENETSCTDATNEDEPIPSCSYSVGKSQDDASTSVSIKETPPEPSKLTNIFASNNLDGFLQEKDLNISYNVPNLKSTNHNINLLDDCVLVDVEQERKAEMKRKSLGPENEDSNSSGGSVSKEQFCMPKVDSYKPRTLAEKRKMLIDEKDTKGRKESKKIKLTEAISPLPQRKEEHPEATVKIKTTSQSKTKAQPEAVNDISEDDLLIPIEDKVREHEFNDDTIGVRFLTEEESKPKTGVISKLRIRVNYRDSLPNVFVPTRVPVKRTFYRKVEDIRRKHGHVYIPVDNLNANKRKPSILTSPPDVDYKPGPMCKKHELQVNGTKNWRTVVMELPKVNVTVKPGLGKKMIPCVYPFVKFDTFDISQTRADFAISALAHRNKTENEGETFTFPAHYKHKQEKIILRKMVVESKVDIVTKMLPETEEETAKSIECVIERMLDYVETIEVESSLAHYDTELCDVEDVKMPLSVKIEDAPATDGTKEVKKEKREMKKRRAPLYTQLRNLNVLIVDLPKEEKTDVKSNCTNAYCRLGCVCQSISTRYPPSTHCGEAKCIFSCICGFERRCKTNGLNERTLSRLNKEAKRNITAREERDFTQTAIRSSDNTIILGPNRESKRTPKYNFKRFQGFHMSFTPGQTAMYKHVNRRIIQCDQKLNHCSVELIRCDFTDLIPFCLVHNLYDCYCRGLAPYDVQEQRLIAKCQSSKDDVLDAADGFVEPAPKKAVKMPPMNPSPVKTSENCVNNSYGMAARIRGTGEFYRTRNSTNKYKIIMARKLKYDKAVDQALVNRWFILPSDVRGANGVNMPSTNSSRRKQNLTAINAAPIDCDSSSSSLAADDDNQFIIVTDEPAAKKSGSNKRQTPSILTAEPKTVRHCLKHIGTTLTISGALYSPTDTISKKFSQMIGTKTTPTNEFRLLLWPSLMILYTVGDIQIWYSSSNNKLRFVITDSLTNPKEGYKNIRTFEGNQRNEIKVDFIKWIITKTLPENKKANSILVILKINEFYWEICGICAKHQSIEKPLKRQSLLKKNQRFNSDNPQLCAETVDLDDMEDLPTEVVPIKEEVETVTEKYYKTVQQVIFANGVFVQKELILTDPSDKNKGDEGISAALPNITNQCRWRVLKVNSTFAILSFTKNEFSIKCSDILTVMKVSARYNKTIIINTTEVSANYKHKLFGIYIPPTYQDRIFIGPYLIDEEHGLETLRFVNNKLVNTEVFNAMRCITNIACTGLWYHQAPYPIKQAMPSMNSVIDLTRLDEVRTLIKSSDLTITPTATKEATIQPEQTEVEHETNTVIIPIEEESTKSYKINNDLTVKVPKSTNILPINDGTSENVLIPTLENEIEAGASASRKPQKKEVKMPELIKIPLPNKVNKNITNVTPTSLNADLSQICMVETIIERAQKATPQQLEVLFEMRLKIIMERMRMVMPQGAKPICFRLNFGNGVILGFTYHNRVSVYWPGDRKPKIEFGDIQYAITWLRNELHAVFICIPTTFHIMVTPVGPSHYLDYINRSVISQKYFKEICVIGDFGIMRLSEAEQFLLCENDVSKLKLTALKGKSEKFKKAINTILDHNDMTKAEFIQKVANLIENAKAAADRPYKKETRRKRKQKLVTNPHAHEVITLDSENDDISDAAMTSENDSNNSAASKTASLSWTKIQQTLNKDVEISPTKSREKNIMRIDLTHMTTAKAKEMLKTFCGDRKTLTADEVKGLRVFSEFAKKNGVHD